MMGVDEVALDKVGMEEVALDEIGVDEVAITHRENRDNCLDEFHLSAEDGFDFFFKYIYLYIFHGFEAEKIRQSQTISTVKWSNGLLRTKKFLPMQNM